MPKKAGLLTKIFFRILDRLSIPSKYKLRQQLPCLEMPVISCPLVVQGKEKQFIDYMSFIKVEHSQEGLLQALILYKAKEMSKRFLHGSMSGEIIFSNEDLMRNVDL